MSIIDLLFRRPNAFKLRKKYDRLREKADKIGKIEQRLEVLRMLDQVEPSVISLEEHHMSHYEKKKVYDYVGGQLRKIKFMIDESKREIKEEKDERKHLKDEEPYMK